MVWIEDSIWLGLGPGLIVGRARWFPLTAAGSTSIHSLDQHIADLVLGLERLVLHHRVTGYSLKNKNRQKRKNVQKFSGGLKVPNMAKKTEKKFLVCGLFNYIKRNIFLAGMNICTF